MIGLTRIFEKRCDAYYMALLCESVTLMWIAVSKSTEASSSLSALGMKVSWYLWNMAQKSAALVSYFRERRAILTRKVNF